MTNSYDSLQTAKDDYLAIKADLLGMLCGNSHFTESDNLNELLSHESAALSSSSPESIQTLTESLNAIRHRLLFKTPVFLAGYFQHMVDRRLSMSDQCQANVLIEAAQQHIASEEWEALRPVLGCLRKLLPIVEQESRELKYAVQA